jgi:hypothetical protein
MKNGLLFPLVARLCAAELVTAAYVGILGRAPDDAGLKAHADELGWRRGKATKGLAEMLAGISRSPERWKRSLEQRAEELVRIAFAAVLKREPSLDELRSAASPLQKSGDVGALLAMLAASQEHWEQLLEGRSEELALTLYRATFGRDPASAVLRSYAAQLRASGDLTTLLLAIGTSEDFWHKQITHRAADLVRTIFRTLLGREPEEEALKSYAEQLKEHKSLEQTLRAVARSPEHFAVAQRESAEDLVRTVFAALLKRDPEEEALTSCAASIRQGQPLGEVLSAVANSQEHWQLMLREHAEEIVKTLFRALLRREPDSHGLAGHAQHLRTSNDLAAVIAAIGNSRERDLLLKKESDWPNPARTYDETTWVFIHVEKTGGTSLQNMLLEAFGPARVFNEHQDSLHLHSPAELSMYSAFAGHFNHDSLAYIPRRELKVFMFVREPIQRLLSLYSFWRSHDPSAPHFHESMQLARDLGIDEYYALTETARSPSTWNHMTWCVMGNRQWRVWLRLLASARGERRARLIESLRVPIRERLREFCFVGLQEKFAQSCRELFGIIARPCPEVRADHSVEQLSATTAYIKKTAKPALTPRAIEVMSGLVELDTILYEEAKTMFEERLACRRTRSRARRVSNGHRAPAARSSGRGA